MSKSNNNTQYAALWLLGRGYSIKVVAKLHGVSPKSVERWKQTEEKVRSKNMDSLIAHFSSKLLK